MAAAAATARRDTTPRPSVSPLSMTSRANQLSSPLEKDVAARHAAADGDAGARNTDGVLDDDTSSSLSDPDDDNEDDDELTGGEDDLQDEGRVEPRKALDVDSEAETERLEQTPHKQRRLAEHLGRTPSKLSQAATADDELSDPPSPLLADPGAASSTSTVGTMGNKRKRSDTAESSLTSADSDLGESPRKRSNPHPPNPQADADGIADETEHVTELTDAAVETPNADDAQEAPPIPSKGAKGKKGKAKGKKQREPAAEQDETIDAIEVGEEPVEDIAAKAEDEAKQKEASGLFEDVAKQFRAFRDKLYNERLAAMTAELRLLSQPICEHPEYVRQVACVDARLQKQRTETHAFYRYRLKCISERTLGDRGQLHGQYFQHVREVRERVLDKLGHDWYAIQKERRQAHQENNDAHIFKFPERRSVQIRRQTKYNQEVSVLSGVAKYIGFPAAPEINGADGGELENDLKAMKIFKRLPQPTAHTHTSTVHLPNKNAASIIHSERLAHEQFIEQNAWARPQAPLHPHATPGISHTPDWAEPAASAKHLIRTIGHQQVQQSSSPFATPVPQKRTLPEPSSSGTIAMNSDGREPPSSMMAAPPTTDRASFFHQSGGGGSSNQTSPITVPKNRQNGAELTGFRNLSGLSGASTIDATPDPESERRQNEHRNPSFPGSSNDHAAQQPFSGTRPIYRYDDRQETFPVAGFRPQEGAFGTPAPLPTTSRT